VDGRGSRPGAGDTMTLTGILSILTGLWLAIAADAAGMVHASCWGTVVAIGVVASGAFRGGQKEETCRT
jgi:hypothetical protein